MKSKIQVFKDISDFSSKWASFQKSSQFTSFQSIEWVSHWHNTINKKNKSQLNIVHVTDQKDQTILILPFVIEKKYGIKILNMLGGDYYGILSTKDFNKKYSKNDFITIWNKALKMIDNFDLIYISNVPENIGFNKNPMHLYLNLKKLPYKSHQAIIETSWLDYSKTIKKKIIKDTERQINRLNQKGKISFQIASTKIETQKIVDHIIKFKSIQYEKTGVSNHLKDKYVKKFYSKSFNAKSSFIISHTSCIKIDGEIIAAHWGLVDYLNKTFYYLLPAHNNKNWSKFSPGRILMINLMQWSLKNNIYTFDFTGGNEPYKSLWANNSFNLYYYLRPNSISGYFIYAIIQVKKILFKSNG